MSQEEATPEAEGVVASAAEDLAAEDLVADEREPVETPHAPVQVAIERSVRIGPIIIGLAVLGIVAGALASLFFPVEEGANYTLGQAAGLMAVVGGVIGLAVGALLSLMLTLMVRRQRGAAIVVQTDVR